MEQIKADPTQGRIIELNKGMTDPRWPQKDGWEKMSWRFIPDPKNPKKCNVIAIHYVAQWINDKIQAIDDFKFKSS